MPGHLENTIEYAHDVYPSSPNGNGPAAPEVNVYAMPATQGQVRFWSLDQLNPGNPALNMPLMWQCTGPLDIPLMEYAFNECVQRHESLRTTFSRVDGKLMQIIHPQMHVPIPMDDLTALSGETLRLEKDRITREHAAFRFDLANDCLLQLRMLKLGEQSHLLLVTMHHVICDGISNGILMRDMEEFYEAGLQQREPKLPELPIQFADYAVWHEDWRKGPEHEAALQFWRDTLGKEFTAIRLPHDADAPAALPEHHKDSTGDIQTLLVPPDLTARAQSFCRREGVTLNVLLFSIFAGLLSRLTGQKDLAIGSPCANRTEDTEELIGMFMNIQVLRVHLEESSSFRDLLRQVNDWTLAAVEKQALPFEDIINDEFFAQTQGGLEIPVFFLYQKSFMLIRRIASAAGSLQIVPLRSESPGAIFEFMFAVVDRDEEGPRLQLEYNPQFYKATTVQNILRLFVNLLESALVSPATPVEQLDLLSPSSRDQILRQWNNTAQDLGTFEAVQETFLRRAAQAPNEVAATCNGVSWTNAQLAARATSIARMLTSHGLRRGGLVGLALSRSLDMPAAMLGVLMAGGAYVPLDLRHPRERMEMVLADADVAIVLTDRNLDVTTLARIVRIDVAHPESAASLPSTITGEDLAYVIYTSGSTGRPKGVAIEQAALVNLLRSMAQRPGLSADDTLVAVTTLAFDIAALELLLPLITGAKLVIATEEQVQNPSALLTLIRESHATVVQATPGAWRTLIDAGWSTKHPLRVLCGGEAMSRDLADKLLDRSTDVWNVYGPTETTIWSAATRVEPGVIAPRIGHGIANTQFYILDSHRNPVPVGIDGELYIGGDGLARGYWNKPELTAQRFTKSPFGPGRIYQTGDLARWHDDGTIQLLGRADFQVKVRGYRIELGEIEAALMKHSAVREAVVVHDAIADQPDRAGVTRLIAYVDAGAHSSAEAAPKLIRELENLLGRTTPEYMMPNAIVVLERLPRNTNGKIDRKALPAAFDTASDAGIRTSEDHPEDFVGPRDIIERQLVEMWQSTLGIPRISVRASFFSLGVGSLAALRLVTKMNRLYGMDLGLANLVTASSVEAVADIIRNRISAKSSSCIVPLKTDGDELPLFIVHGVGGNVINFYGLAMRIDACQPVYGIQAQSLLHGQPALLQLEDMAAHYIEEMRKIQPHGPYRLLGYSFGGTVALEMARQLKAAGELVAPLGMLDARSLTYDKQFKSQMTAQTKVTRRLNRFRGNTEALTVRNQISYVTEKLKTRSIRWACTLAASLNMKQVPAFMKSTWDINVVAINRYKLRPYDGKLVLFRAAEQEFQDGPRDLGWAGLFTEGIEIKEIDGDHERIFLEPSIDILAASLHKAIQEAWKP